MDSPKKKKVLVVGAGLAGIEAAYFLARHDVLVVLAECKSILKNPAQKISTFSELVCSNSLKSSDPNSAHGILKYEMEALDSLIISQAKKVAVPAGSALAVDRVAFSQNITKVINDCDNIEVLKQVVDDPQALADDIGAKHIILASGPLTTTNLELWIKKNVVADESDFYFYDAIAPIVDADSLDYSKLYFKDRYDEKVLADYLNAPLTKQQYELFVDELLKAKKIPSRDFEQQKFFEGCLPIDVMAQRGRETLRFSCMKPVGLSLPDGPRPYAVIQLRRENLLGDAYSMVGFQTRLLHKEQLRVFRMIPGFENAVFNHLGSVHRNSFLNSKKVLNYDLSSKKIPNLYFAGQIVGVEGYTESAAMGIYAGICVLRKLLEKPILKWPVETAIGALVNYIMTNSTPAPSNINFGLLPPVSLTKEQRKGSKNKKKIKKMLCATRAAKIFDHFRGEQL
ncbi:MAG: methylenetetrahydrofolate--tRNA-(uracil(54)-C(5))-methyltransferase (FADH(2)-oxidizing) TrmFO [Bacteriovoracaceae bacterium]|nr:methylenetetrahydrofolate--tRNA-(uracil(54)-C(5))-methyltransferase (FADH(2)-oxidizing) TrmFO [Bacteriovoracaceae bacterium]